jgi:hypothetical protein
LQKKSMPGVSRPELSMFIPDDLSPPFEQPTRPAATVSRGSFSRCFRTTADGRIPLIPDWPAIFEAARTLGRIAVQTRHAYARVVATVELPAFAWTPDSRGAAAADGSLQFQLDERHRAWGRLAECECCGTSGRIELRNEHDLEFLQLCPLPEYAPGLWAGFLDGLAEARAACVWPGATDVARTRGRVPCSFPSIPTHALTLGRDAHVLAPLLAALGDAGVPLRCQMVTREARHTREFIARQVIVGDGLLTAGERYTRFQLGLPIVRSLALSDADDVWVLHIGGPDDTSLLALTSGDDPAADAAWRSTVRRAFPVLR